MPKALLTATKRHATAPATHQRTNTHPPHRTDAHEMGAHRKGGAQKGPWGVSTENKGARGDSSEKKAARGLRRRHMTHHLRFNRPRPREKSTAWSKAETVVDQRDAACKTCWAKAMHKRSRSPDDHKSEQPRDWTNAHEHDAFGTKSGKPRTRASNYFLARQGGVEETLFTCSIGKEKYINTYTLLPCVEKQGEKCEGVEETRLD
jgi:hypothetical protein